VFSTPPHQLYGLISRSAGTCPSTSDVRVFEYSTPRPAAGAVASPTTSHATTSRVGRGWFAYVTQSQRLHHSRWWPIPEHLQAAGRPPGAAQLRGSHGMYHSSVRPATASVRGWRYARSSRTAVSARLLRVPRSTTMMVARAASRGSCITPPPRPERRADADRALAKCWRRRLSTRAMPYPSTCGGGAQPTGFSSSGSIRPCHQISSPSAHRRLCAGVPSIPRSTSASTTPGGRALSLDVLLAQFSRVVLFGPALRLPV